MIIKALKSGLRTGLVQYNKALISGWSKLKHILMVNFKKYKNNKMWSSKENLLKNIFVIILVLELMVKLVILLISIVQLLD